MTVRMRGSTGHRGGRRTPWPTGFALGVMLLACTLDEPLGQPPASSFTPVTVEIALASAPEPIQAAVVTPAFFEVEGLAPLLARFPLASEYDAPREPVAVLSHGFWAERFDSDPSLIGTRIALDGRPTLIVGVAPPDFEPEGAGSLWLPARAH